MWHEVAKSLSWLITEGDDSNKVIQVCNEEGRTTVLEIAKNLLWSITYGDDHHKSSKYVMKK